MTSVGLGARQALATRARPVAATRVCVAANMGIAGPGMTTVGLGARQGLAIHPEAAVAMVVFLSLML